MMRPPRATFPKMSSIGAAEAPSDRIWIAGWKTELLQFSRHLSRRMPLTFNSFRKKLCGVAASSR